VGVFGVWLGGGGGGGGGPDLAWSLPFTFFAIAATQWQRRFPRATVVTLSPNAANVRRARQYLAPIGLSLGVVALAIQGITMQKTIAVILIFGSVLCYFTRSAMAQGHGNRLLAKTRSALRGTKRLKGYLPICAACKKIRDEGGRWQQLEGYLRQHTEAEFTHGICPPCATQLYPEHFNG
jgi:hypothetical protein